MAYLKNSTVNLLNLHYGLHWLIINGAGVFYLVFLLRANVPVPAVFGTLALIVAGRFLFRPLILVLAPRFGLRKLLIFGTVFSGLQYVVLAEVRGIDLMLLALILASAAGDIFYWTTYHAYFAKLGDAEHRGHQIGAREAIGSLAAIIGPLIGAWALVALGPRAAFGAAAAQLGPQRRQAIGDITRQILEQAYLVGIEGVGLGSIDIEHAGHLVEHHQRQGDARGEAVA